MRSCLAHASTWLILAIALAGCRDVQRDPNYCADCTVDAGSLTQPVTDMGGSEAGSTTSPAVASSGVSGMPPAADGGEAGRAAPPAAGSAGAPVRMDAGSSMDAGRDAGGSAVADAGDASPPDQPAKPDAGPPDAGAPPDTTPPNVCGRTCPRDAPVCDPARRACVECTADDKHFCSPDKPVCDAITQVCVPCSADDPGVCKAPAAVCELASRSCVQCTATRQDTCTGDKPACDTANKACVECTAAMPDMCPNERRACDTDNKRCVECTAARPDTCPADKRVCDTGAKKCVECSEGQTSSCDAAGKRCWMQSCVQCTENRHCTSPEHSACDANNHACQACTNDSQCMHLTATPLCELGQRLCVQCTKATERQRCGEGMSCNESTHTCQAVAAPPARGLCLPCAQDAECGSAAGCVSYLGLPNTCMPRPVNGNCTTQPYVRKMTVASSGGYGEFCLPPASCKAVLNAAMKVQCSQREGQSCGERNLGDGACNAANTCSYRCTNPLECPPAMGCNDQGVCQ